MPITDELKSINKLEAAGFTHDQAKAIVEVQEESIQRGFERMAEVLDRRFGELDHRFAEFEHRMTEMELRLRNEIQGVRIEMQAMKAELIREQRDLMLKFAALVSLIALVTGAVVKFL
ncbi:MAG: hypothetical protein HY423_13515 [Candidatus Lambdaproteobacteria bacterium]|nr:hypothetical protein [Candidatus Lambdaproteobacteria bacterium]